MNIRNRDFAAPQKKAIAWTVAGSDCSGGAGLQADSKSFNSFGVYGCNIVTAVTAQNSQSVSDVLAMPAAQIRSQWLALQDEYRPDVIKLGMLANAEVVDEIIACLQAMDKVPVVCDPVLIATNGGSLMESSQSYHKLLPLVDVITPNEEEFATLFDVRCETPEQLAEHALRISAQYQIDLVITDGESRLHPDWASDCCIINREVFWMHSPRRNTMHTHGTGCSFASALAASLALGYSRYEACVLAKTYLNQGLALEDFFFHGASGFQHNSFPHQLDKLPLISHKHHVEQYTFPRCDSLQLGVYPVVDDVEWLGFCMARGVKTIQLRLKDRTQDELEAAIKEAVRLGEKYSARLYVNDHWELAIKYGAYGVHLGQEDIQSADLKAIADAGLHLGISTHSWYEIAVAHSIRPSYIAIGPVFATTTKVMPFAPQGLTQLAQWSELIGDAYPIVAIGGIDASNAKDVLAAGAGSIAVVRAVTQAADPVSALAQLLDCMKANP